MRVCDEEILKTAMTYLKYNKDTGEFKWVFKRPGPQREGNVAGTKDASGYIKIWLCGSQHYAHRLAWFMIYGKMPSGVIDHINRNRADNRISNLRQVSKAENQFNTGLKADNTSGYRGVGYDKRKGRWYASCIVRGKSSFLGYFDTADEAGAVAESFRKENHTFENV